MMNKQLAYYRLRRDHPDMSPADAMEIAGQQAEAPQEDLTMTIGEPRRVEPDFTVGTPRRIEPAQVTALEPTITSRVPQESGHTQLMSAIQRTGFAPAETQSGTTGASFAGEPKPEVPAAGGVTPVKAAPSTATGIPLVQAPGQAELDTEALDAAKENDRKAHLSAGMELAGRQLVAGLTRTSVPQGVGARADTAPGVVAGQAAKKKTLAEYLALQRQGKLDESTLGLQKSETEKNYAEAMKAKLEKPDKEDPESLRALLASPVYAGALAAKKMTPEALKTLGAPALKDLVTQLRTDTTNEATVEAGRQSAGIAATRALGNAKEMKRFENELPSKPDTETRKQAEALGQVDDVINRLEAAYRSKVGDASSGAASLVPGTMAHTYQTDERNQAKEMLVRAMSQTVPREANMAVVEPQIPTGLDRNEVAAEKIRGLRAYFKDQKAQFAKTLKASNVRPMGDVGGVEDQTTGNASVLIRNKKTGETAQVPTSDAVTILKSPDYELAKVSK